MSGPLKGTKVLSFGRMLSGPFSTMLLSDLGAEVIKVEAPKVGDDSRHFGPFLDEEHKKSAYFMSINAGKKSVTLNLKHESGKKALTDLIKQADVLIVAATNKDPQVEIQHGRLRQDFFYRICVIEIKVPPLRDRKDDLPLLIEHILERYRQRQNRMPGRDASEIPTDQTLLPGELIQALYGYDWPGNIRELRNLIERAMILSHDNILRIDVPSQTEVQQTSDLTLQAIEKHHIEAALKATGWRLSGKRGAAQRLGLKPTTLRSRMDKLGILRPERVNKGR